MQRSRRTHDGSLVQSMEMSSQNNVLVHEKQSVVDHLHKFDLTHAVAFTAAHRQEGFFSDSGVLQFFETVLIEEIVWLGFIVESEEDRVRLHCSQPGNSHEVMKAVENRRRESDLNKCFHFDLVEQTEPQRIFIENGVGGVVLGTTSLDVTDDVQSGLFEVVREEEQR